MFLSLIIFDDAGSLFDEFYHKGSKLKGNRAQIIENLSDTFNEPSSTIK